MGCTRRWVAFCAAAFGIIFLAADGLEADVKLRTYCGLIVSVKREG